MTVFRNGIVCLLRAAGAGLCLALLAAGGALAGTTGNLSGTVVDVNGPVVGATVGLTGPNAPGGRTVVTAADGTYRFLAIGPGAYTITVVFAGGAPVTREGVQVASDRSTTVPPISLTVERVEVKSQSIEAEMIHPGSTALGQSLDAAKLEALPTARSYESVVEILSGSAGDDGSGGQSIYGASGLESTYVIDGVNTTAVMTGKPGKSLNFDFIEEIQVKTGGYEPEF
ncbi:MAG TPA: carboxypeptidase-like regulatory domain-containing protein, partial [Candidatus Polarisedimenticolia bacterium]